MLYEMWQCIKSVEFCVYASFMYSSAKYWNFSSKMSAAIIITTASPLRRRLASRVFKIQKMTRDNEIEMCNAGFMLGER
jgi:hypothetical protein